jgi:predicted AAA+ superfamily ATPase
MEGVLDFLENEGVSEGETHEALFRIAEAVERLAPAPPAPPDFAAADAFAWHPNGRRLAPVARVNRVDMALLKGIDRVRDLLVENTERFARGLPANNALLWGARGMGKSSLVKAVHAAVNGARAASKALLRSSSLKSTARTLRACPT